MSKPSSNWMDCCTPNGFLSCALLMVGAVVLLFLALTPAVLFLQGAAGLQPAAMAALVSLLVGFTVLGVSHLPSLRAKPLVSMLLATALRMIPLLAIGVAVALTRDKNEHFGFVCYLVLFYIATLAIETYSAVQLAQSHATSLSHTAREPQA